MPSSELRILEFERSSWRNAATHRPWNDFKVGMSTNMLLQHGCNSAASKILCDFNHDQRH